MIRILQKKGVSVEKNKLIQLKQLKNFIEYLANRNRKDNSVDEDLGVDLQLYMILEEKRN